MNTLLKTLLGVGLYLLERSDSATKSARDRAGDRTGRFTRCGAGEVRNCDGPSQKGIQSHSWRG